MGYLIKNQCQSSTVKSYISAMKAILKSEKIEVNEDQYLISSLTRACKLTNDQIKTRLPIRKGMLRMVLEQTYLYYEELNQPYLAILYTTIISTMYHGLLRISEVASSKRGSHPVRARDVNIGENKKKFLLVLRTSKTHWKNMKPQMIKISASKYKAKTVKKVQPKEKLPCPYFLLKLYAKVRGGYKRNTDPFFVHRDGTPVVPSQITKCLKEAIKRAGFDETLYSSHSLRIGRTGDLYRLGLSVETIKKLGRWCSNAVYRYLRQ